MKVWDLHCDTLYEIRNAVKRGEEIDFENSHLQIDLNRMRRGDYLLQCFACYVNLEEERHNPLKACMEMIDIFYALLERWPEELMQIAAAEDIRKLRSTGKVGCMLTVEEGGVCLGDVRILRDLYRLGVRMMTFTWNYRNELGNPNVVPDSVDAVWPCAPVTDAGLTQTGFAFLEEMERLHMIADVSHLSDAGFWDVASHARRPFAASHSNARSVAGHVRNLTDEMIRAMGERGCLIGLNYCPAFADPATGSGHEISRIMDLAKHAGHIMDIGGEDILALGSDFDGITGELEITGAQDVQKLADGLRREGFSERVIEKIFYGNAMRFFEENL